MIQRRPLWVVRLSALCLLVAAVLALVGVGVLSAEITPIPTNAKTAITSVQIALNLTIHNGLR